MCKCNCFEALTFNFVKLQNLSFYLELIFFLMFVLMHKKQNKKIAFIPKFFYIYLNDI